MTWNKQLIRYVMVMLIQVLILNRLQLVGVCHPYLYIMCLIMLPITLPRELEQVLAALLGLIMDLFCNSLGVHMAACVLISFMRHPMVKNLVMDIERLHGEISVKSIGVVNFLKYAIVLIVVYHMLVVLASAWSFAHIGLNALQILISSFVSGILIIGYDILRNK